MASTPKSNQNATKNLKKPLTAQEELFVDEYMSNGFIAAEAARVAYPKSSAPADMGWKVRLRPKVKAEIERRMKHRLAIKNITKDRFTEEVAEIALSKDTKDRDKLSAIELLSKLSGWQAPTKLEVENNVITVTLVDED